MTYKRFELLEINGHRLPCNNPGKTDCRRRPKVRPLGRSMHLGRWLPPLRAVELEIQNLSVPLHDDNTFHVLQRKYFD